jgi:hypothetical protein
MNGLRLLTLEEKNALAVLADAVEPLSRGGYADIGSFGVVGFTRATYVDPVAVRAV